MKLIKKYFGIFLLSGLIYLAIEIIFKVIFKYRSLRLVADTSVWMMPIGGFLCLILGELNRFKKIRQLKMIFQALIGMIIITAVELITGIILNIILKLNLWDYSHEVGNILGQISIVHSFCWFIISPLVFWFDDYMKAKIYNEGKEYSIIENYKKLLTFE